ncbi:hypothetical protein LXL04_008564 [Taraxacum kok-saghyz]
MAHWKLWAWSSGSPVPSYMRIRGPFNPLGTGVSLMSSVKGDLKSSSLKASWYFFASIASADFFWVSFFCVTFCAGGFSGLGSLFVILLNIFFLSVPRMAPLVVYRVLGDESQDTRVDPSFGLDFLKLNNAPLESAYRYHRFTGLYRLHGELQFYLVRAGAALTVFNAFDTASCHCVTVTLAVNGLSFLGKDSAGPTLLVVINLVPIARYLELTRLNSTFLKKGSSKSWLNTKLKQTSQGKRCREFEPGRRRSIRKIMESVDDFDTIDVELDELLITKPTQRCQDGFLNTLCVEGVANLEEGIPEEEEEDAIVRENEDEPDGEAEQKNGIEFTTHDPKIKWNKMIPYQGERIMMNNERSFQIKIFAGEHICVKNYKTAKLMNPTWWAKCYRAKCRAMSLIEGSIITVCVDDNPDNTTIFLRMYIYFKAIKDGWKLGCRRVIGLDGAFLKSQCKKG